MRTITLEEHFATPRFLKSGGINPPPGAVDIEKRLTDLGEGRISEMDAAGIDVQVLSLTQPGVESFEPADAETVAHEANDYVVAAVERNPRRFAGFAALPTPVPQKAALELERLVCRHGFKGAVINGHSRGRYLDDQFYWPILEAAEALAVPIYLHPTVPPKPVVDAYYSGFDPSVSRYFSLGGWGWHIDTAVHVIRLVLRGVFDRFPKLQVIIGHLGEAIPFMVQRMDATMPPSVTKLQRPISSYMRENVHYTTSGCNFIPAFLDLFMEMGSDRIMFSTDHPYSSMAKSLAFLNNLPVSTADKERIAHGNAERLLRM